MADLLTHACVALSWKYLVDGRHKAVFVAGTLAPDVLARVPPIALHRFTPAAWELPVGLSAAWVPLHLPVGMALAAWVLAFFFREGVRKAVFANLLAGMALHLGIDVFQEHFGVGYMLAWPVSSQPVEIGLIGSEDSVLVAPLLLLCTLALGLWRGRRGRRSAG